MKCNKCGYDDQGTGDTAHACSVKPPEMTLQDRLRDYINNTRDCVLRKEAADRIDELEKQLEAKQAEIDRLTLEYCPDELTNEQIENWDNLAPKIDAFITSMEKP